MFELSILRRYLWPKRKSLSLTLIAFMSVFVISLVVWLLILFLSITEGIEKNWLGRLTSLNAPIRITPTDEYYRSYYHLIDEYSFSSSYEKKSLHEKLTAKITDPYDSTLDSELPLYVPKPILSERGGVLDLTKELSATLDSLPGNVIESKSHDYQLTGALLRLTLARKAVDGHGLNDTPNINFLTQASYVSSIPLDRGPLHSLITKPAATDINHLLYLASINKTVTTADVPEQEIASDEPFSERVIPILDNISIEKFSTKDRFSFPQSVINDPIIAYGRKIRGQIFYYMVPQYLDSAMPEGDFVKGVIKRDGDRIVFSEKDEEKIVLDPSTPLLFSESIDFTAQIDHLSLLDSNQLADIALSATFTIQDKQYQPIISWRDIEIKEATIENDFSLPPKTTPPWAHFVQDRLMLPNNGVLLPVHFKEQGCKIGDDGYFAFGKTSPMMVSEQRKKIYNCGFYDPGVINTGARYILASRDVVDSICTKDEGLIIDPLIANGFQVWFEDTYRTKEVTEFIKADLKKKGLDPFFKVTPFYEYDFAKDLIGQFQSDRDLFMLIGLIILLVAVCNIITLLLLLVHDKKTEIGIFLSLGASKRKIATIFALAGILLGGLAAFIGSTLAYSTLKNIDSLIWILNNIEGRDAFNAAFYGTSLPSAFSMQAFAFVMIAAPILSLLAGLIPAIKACSLRPSQILRSE